MKLLLGVAVSVWMVGFSLFVLLYPEKPDPLMRAVAHDVYLPRKPSK